MNINKHKALTLWLLASLFYSYQYILRVMPSVLMPAIMDKFSLNAKIFGQFSGFYYIGYTLMHLPISILLDRHGPKNILPFFILLTSIGMIPLIYSDYWLYAIIGRVLVGVGSSAAILGIFKVVRINFEEQYFASLLSISVTIGLLGAIYGGAPLNYLYSKLGYNKLIELLIFSGVVISFLIWILAPNQTHNNIKENSVVRNIINVISQPKLFIICVLAGLMVGPMEGFADVWGINYLINVYHLNPSVAAALPSNIFLGMCIGSPIISLLAQKTQKYIEIIIASALIMTLSFIWILSTTVNTQILLILFFIVGVLSSYQIIAIYKASTYIANELKTLSTAIANMIIMTFGYFYHICIGKLIFIFNSSTEPSQFSPKSYLYGISVIPAGLGIACIGLIIFAILEKNNNQTNQNK